MKSTNRKIARTPFCSQVLFSLNIHRPRSRDLQLPICNFRILTRIQLIHESDQPRGIRAVTLLGTLPQVVGRDALIVQRRAHCDGVGWQWYFVAHDAAAASSLIGRVGARADRGSDRSVGAVERSSHRLDAIVFNLVVET